MENTDFESVGAALDAPVPSARGQLTEQVVTRMELVFEDPICPVEAARTGEIVERGERTASYFLSKKSTGIHRHMGSPSRSKQFTEHLLRTLKV